LFRSTDEDSKQNSLQWWRREPEEHFADDSKLLLGLANEVKERMKKGLAYPSTATRALEKQGAFGLNDLETAYALSAPFVAGTGTVGVVESSLQKRNLTHHGLCRLLE
jgi:hypothetical protein